MFTKFATQTCNMADDVLAFLGKRGLGQHADKLVDEGYGKESVGVKELTLAPTGSGRCWL